MATTAHSYGPNCTLQPDSNPFTRRASQANDVAPMLRAHFFYSSALPIDDPLSPVPPPSSSSNAGPSKVPPRPFSIHDNHALEQAWQGLNKEKGSLRQDSDTRTDSDSPSVGSDQHKVQRALTSLGGPRPTPATVDNLAKIIRSAHERRYIKLSNEQSTKEKDRVQDQEDRAAGSSSVSTDVHKHHEAGDPHLTLCDNPDHIPFDHAMPVGSDEIDNEEFGSGMAKKRLRSSFRRHDKTAKMRGSEMTIPRKKPTGQSKQSPETTFGGSPSERDTTGTPFLRVPDRIRRSRSRSSQRKSATSQTDGADSIHERENTDGSRTDVLEIGEPQGNITYRHLESIQGAPNVQSSTVHEEPSVLVPVGVSRLHMVELPMLTVCTRNWPLKHSD